MTTTLTIIIVIAAISLIMAVTHYSISQTQKGAMKDLAELNERTVRLIDTAPEPIEGESKKQYRTRCALRFQDLLIADGIIKIDLANNTIELKVIKQ